MGRIWKWIVETIFEPISCFFQKLFCSQSEIFDPLSFSLESIQEEVLMPVEHLPLPDAKVLQQTLPNIGSTCYMNATLQMIARSQFFDVLFETEPKDPNQQALQTHLKAIICRMRLGGSAENVTHANLRTLFVLCQANGWYRMAINRFTEGDSFEFLDFLTRLFDLSIPCQSVDSSSLTDPARDTLILIKNRVSYDPRIRESIRVTTPVPFHETINVADSKNYRLIAVICHLSNNVLSGHYVSYIMHESNTGRCFMKYDDNRSHVVDDDQKSEIEQNCTLLIYELV